MYKGLIFLLLIVAKILFLSFWKNSIKSHSKELIINFKYSNYVKHFHSKHTKDQAMKLNTTKSTFKMQSLKLKVDTTYRKLTMDI